MNFFGRLGNLGPILSDITIDDIAGGNPIAIRAVEIE